MKSVEELDVFHKAHQLTLKIYTVTGEFPDSERFGLVSQMRRAASSINANLMEGSHRNNSGEYRHFAGIARGSAGELKYHLMLSRDLGFLSENDYSAARSDLEEICRMLTGLIKALEG